jgi:hypothetical protein
MTKRDSELKELENEIFGSKQISNNLRPGKYEQDLDKKQERRMLVSNMLETRD